jgi:hypothetical protein
MTPALIASLEAVAAMMAPARDRWWVIASAAMALHGAELVPADIDLLTSARDGRRLLATQGFARVEARPSPRFRSALHARCDATPVPIELMADFAIAGADGWQRLVPATRLYRAAGRVHIPVPAIAELIEQCHLYGRAKDRQRAAILQRLAG